MSFTSSGVNLKNFYFIICIAVPVVFSECPKDYTLYGKSTCLSEIRYQYDRENMKSNCKDDGAKVGGPFADDIWDEFSKYVEKDVLKKVESITPWIGIIKKPQSGFSDDGKWKYTYDNEEFDPDDYPYFKRKPKKNEDCAYLSLVDFKVVPSDCNVAVGHYCHKLEAPCDEEQSFLDFYKICLIASNTYAPFGNTRDGCKNGGSEMLALKNDSVLRSAKAIMFNLMYGGGFYTGLEKNSDGDWVYLDGSAGPPDSYWVKDQPKNGKCALLQVNDDFSLQYTTRGCNWGTGYVCQCTAHDTRLRGAVIIEEAFFLISFLLFWNIGVSTWKCI